MDEEHRPPVQITAFLDMRVMTVANVDPMHGRGFDSGVEVIHWAHEAQRKRLIAYTHATNH